MLPRFAKEYAKFDDNFWCREILLKACFKVDAALKKAISAAKSRGFDPEVELSPQQYAAHMRR